jgi:PleD family two-component response regulator
MMERMDAIGGRFEIVSSTDGTVVRRGTAFPTLKNRTMTNTIKILLVDDHPLVRDGLRARLEAMPQFEVVAEAAAAEALEQARHHRSTWC